MSGRGNVMEWVETTEEVIASEECPPDTGNTSTVFTVIEHAETPIQKLLDTMVQGEDPEVDDGFYCVECRALFQDQGEFQGMDGPSFILDSPTPMGRPQRALLTLPHGLMIGRSSIPNAGLGVINQGPTVSPGMHFGPYEGEVTTREIAMQSDSSWEIFKGKDEYEYIDAARDSHSNWMRYVNCARSEEEKNLLAVQYKDSILFHCCRSIQPGDELMVWPSSRPLSRLSDAWTQIWFLKCTPAESNTTLASQIFLCAHCQLSFSTEAYLQRHTDLFHLQPVEDCTTPDVEAVQPGHPPPTAEAENPLTSVFVLTVDPEESKMCSECGKIFKHAHHLKRHKLSVHSNKRPYCCPQCRRCFSQASGLLRHQLVHKKQALVKEPKTVVMKESSTVAGQMKILREMIKESVSELAEAEEPTKEEAELAQEESGTSPNIPQESSDEHSNPSQQKADSDPNIRQESSDEHSHKCSQCDKAFTCEGHLRKHSRSVHSNIRPYVCTLCRKSFSQYTDLARHLKIHQKGKGRKGHAVGETTTDKFVTVCCDNCLLTFSSEDSLQRHVSQHHPEETPKVAPADDPERRSPSPSDGNQDADPDFNAPPSVAKTTESILRPLSQRPQRLGARSRISAITKLIAPKRRQSVSKKTSGSLVQTEESCGETEVPDANHSQQTGKLAKLGRYRCRHCEGTYRTQVDLTAHKCPMKQHNCAQCRSTFKTSGFLKRHERKVHGGAKTYTCDRCNRAFNKIGNLKQHQKTNKCEKHHCSSELFSCPFCQFSFTMKTYLRKHVKRHHPVEYLTRSESDQEMRVLGEEEEGESYVCPHCGKTYVSAKYFKAHLCFKQFRILYLCTDCGKGFANHYGLKQHQRIHTGEKPYSCPHCNKSFTYIGQVNVHIRTHTGEKPYLCTHCGESFRQSGDLKRHERKHTGVRPYNCPDCFKSFSRPQSLKAHQMLHLGQRMFKCTECGKSFSRNYHLRRHHQKMHS